jgi:drug/metabolite transporter (DMT)-like permease
MAAFFWGTTFIVQRQAMEHLTPLAFGGLRFTLGALALLPLALPRAARLLAADPAPGRLLRLWLLGGLVSGGFIFIGISFQQYGLLWTTAGKAGFITSLYVVLVPLIMHLTGHRIMLGEALGAALAVVGLYFLSFAAGLFSLSRGDALVLMGAFIWAGHVISLGWLSPKMDSILLGTSQALVCGCLGLLATTFSGQWPGPELLRQAWLPIVWGGFFSVTLGFTLQVIGQKDAAPAPAAIILQMEAVVAVVAGRLFLNEVMTGRMLLGAALMLAGMLLSQLWPILAGKK